MPIHPTTPDEYDDVIELVLRRSPQFNRALVEGPVRDPSISDHRVMLTAVDAGRVVGFAILLHPLGSPASQQVVVVAVDEPDLGTGLGGRLFESVTEDLPDHLEALLSQVDDVDDRAIAAARRWGFEVVQHSVTSRLDLSDVGEPVLPEGLAFDSSPRLEFDDEPDVEAMYDASQTNPEREYAGPSRLAALRSFATPDGAERPVGIVLRDHGRPVAISYGIVLGDLVQVVYTGVHPEARGRGLAALVKAGLHSEAALAGATYAITNNEDNNQGIRHVNETLGYVRDSGICWLRKLLVPGADQGAD